MVNVRCRIPGGSQYAPSNARDRYGDEQYPIKNQKRCGRNCLPFRSKPQHHHRCNQVTSSDTMQHAIAGMKRGQIELQQIALSHHSEHE